MIIADASSETYRNNPLPWAQFKEAWAERVQAIESLYHPDYYLIIKEPGWYIAMVSDARTNPQFPSPSD
ncbi:MAG TPA: hypothetical protein VFF30_19510 [Nitrososphaerales archaeon]|nr:hypothetical protein [Nitrososphaerales archaeon]